MSVEEKSLVGLRGEVKTPPFSQAARLEVGLLLRRLQQGESLGMPRSRQMSSSGARCHELRVRNQNRIWRIIYRIDHDAIVILEIHTKTTRETPDTVIDACRQRLKAYDTD